MRKPALFLAMAALLATGVGASGYVLLGSKWNVSPVRMHLELGSSGTLSDGSASWDDVAAGALGTWNYFLLRLQFTPVVDSNLPGDRDGANNVFFSNTIYGQDFGDAVAVTTEWDAPRSDGEVRSEADVIFNSALNWNSYRGPLRSTSAGETIYDLRRVALHEFGHVVGLNHPDDAGQSVTAVMNSRVSNIDDLQKDDVKGGQFLYGAQPGTFVGDIATIDRPRQNIVTTNGVYFLTGSADLDRVQSVFLVNSRLGKNRFFKAKGVTQWRLSLPLKPGRNVVKLYVRGSNGVRWKVVQRVITRQGD